MKREDALKKSDDALQELAQALQNGKSESLLKYLESVPDSTATRLAIAF